MQMKRIIAALLLGGTYAAAALAAPRAESALECGVAADMAVVAHSLAQEQVQRPKASAIMARIYDVSESDRGRELMKDIIDAAYSPASKPSQSSAQRFAEELFAACMKTGGNMDTVLGSRL
jgi:hypothetical protein